MTIAAAPASGVIPGAVVGVAIDVFNDGNAPAPESKLLVSAPIESEFRTGTLRIDGREVQAPEQLFAHGLPIARLPGATSLEGDVPTRGAARASTRSICSRDCKPTACPSSVPPA